MAIRIQNSANLSPVVTYFDVYPWYMRIFMHTLRVYVNGKVDSSKKKVFLLLG